jgi:hypothetical protein
MKIRVISVLIPSLFALISCAFAQEKAFKFAGSAGIGGIATSEDAKDASKLKEYRDLSDGPLGLFNLRGHGESFHFDAHGENLGREDMSMIVTGGVYGQVKFRFSADWITHAFGFGPDGARTPYLNPGSTNLLLFSTSPNTLRNSSVPPWISFAFKSDRRAIAGDFEYFGHAPWYFRTELSEVSQDGINKVDAAALGTSPGNGFVDLPYPVDFNTRSTSVEGGYHTPRGSISINWTESIFRNANQTLNFQNPFFGFGIDTATFAPNNDYNRISINGMLRNLFWNGTLSGQATYDKGTNSVDMITSVLNTSGSNTLTATNPSNLRFRGNADNETLQFSFASEPLHNLDMRTYYKLYSRHNNSTPIEFQVPLTTSGLVCSQEGIGTVDCSSDRYEYTKHNPGFEAFYKITRENRLSAGFDYLDMKRDRFDANYTREKKVFLQYANYSFSMLTARIKYQYLQRRSDFLINDAGFNANDPYYLERFNRAFDVANLNQHLIKAYLDFTPWRFLDFGFEAYYKRNKYRDLSLGRTRDDRKEFYASATYGDPAKFQVTLFGDIEFINYDSYHRTINASPCPTSAPNCFNPGIDPTTTAFNWSSKLKDKNWIVELGADYPVTEKLSFKGSASIQETNGAVDFQSQTLANGAPATLLFPINSYDNTRRMSINPRAVYLIAGHAELTLGYAYEKYDYGDDQYAGYGYAIGTGTTTSYLSGIYAFPDYRAHIVYSAMRYRF